MLKIFLLLFVSLRTINSPYQLIVRKLQYCKYVKFTIIFCYSLYIWFHGMMQYTSIYGLHGLFKFFLIFKIFKITLKSAFLLYIMYSYHMRPIHVCIRNCSNLKNNLIWFTNLVRAKNYR